MDIQKYFLIVFSLLITFNINAQAGTTRIDLNRFQNSNVTSRDLSEPKNVDGTPFLYDDYVIASVFFRNTDEKPSAVYIKYNMYADQMNISDGKNDTGEELRILPKTPQYDIILKDKKFRFFEFTYNNSFVKSYVEIIKSFDENEYLVMRRSADILQPIGDNSSSYSSKRNPSFTLSKDLYIVHKDGSAILVNNHRKKFYKNMNDPLAKMMKDYIKKNKLKFDDDNVDLEKAVAHYLKNKNQ